MLIVIISRRHSETVSEGFAEGIDRSIAEQLRDLRHVQSVLENQKPRRIQLFFAVITEKRIGCCAFEKRGNVPIAVSRHRRQLPEASHRIQMRVDIMHHAITECLCARHLVGLLRDCIFPILPNEIDHDLRKDRRQQSLGVECFMSDLGKGIPDQVSDSFVAADPLPGGIMRFNDSIQCGFPIRVFAPECEEIKFKQAFGIRFDPMGLSGEGQKNISRFDPRGEAVRGDEADPLGHDGELKKIALNMRVDQRLAVAVGSAELHQDDVSEAQRT